MSGFSDEDLERLKDEKDFLILHRWIVPALLSRLAAAEKVAKMCFECIYEDERPLPGSILDQAHKEWLLSKGGAGK